MPRAKPVWQTFRYPYLRSRGDFTPDEARVIFAWCAAKVILGQTREVPLSSRARFSPQEFYQLCTFFGFPPIAVDAAFERRQRKHGEGFKGLDTFELIAYAALCNKLSYNDVVLPPVGWRELIYDAVPKGKWSKRFPSLAKVLLYFWHPIEGVRYHFRNTVDLFGAKNPYPTSITFFGLSNPRADVGHAYAFVCENREAVSTGGKRHHPVFIEGEPIVYNCQILDTSLWTNIRKDPTDPDKVIYSLDPCKRICKKIWEYFKDWLNTECYRFNPAKLEETYVYKDRQGETQCSAFTCFHARYFCGELPLFIGDYEQGYLYNIIHFELLSRALIDFRALRQRPISYYQGQLRDMVWRPVKEARALYPNRQKLLDLFERYSISVSRKPGRFNLMSVTPLTGVFTKSYFYRYTPRQIEKEAPDDELVGLNWPHIPDEFTYEFPPGMALPDVVTFEWHDSYSGKDTVLRYRNYVNQK